MSEIGETYRLGHQDVEELLDATGGVAPFANKLTQELASVYGDTRLASIDRHGWTTGYKTLEWMECTGPDYRVGKLIGSDPEATTTVNGTMFLFERGKAEASLVCNAGALTSMRTATTTALVLGKLRPSLETLSVVGAGEEGRDHALIAALLSPRIQHIMFSDTVPGKAQGVVEVFEDMDSALYEHRGTGLTVEAVDPDDIRIEIESDAIITTTFGKQEVLSTKLKDGIVIAAIGADMVDKRELGDAIYRQAKFVADDLRQCLREGELQHAAEVLGLDDIERYPATYYGSLLGGRIMGITDLLRTPQAFRSRPEGVTIYDSTGFSGQDLAVGRVLMRMLKEQSWPSTQFHPPEGTTFGELIGRDAA